VANLSDVIGNSDLMSYPYLVVRYTENSFRKLPILFISRDDKEFVNPRERSLVIALPEDEQDGDGFNVSRDLIIDSARLHLADENHPLCVVFDEDDCVYFNQDGSIQESSEPPSNEVKFVF
jgi:hypothetical protein